MLGEPGPFQIINNEGNGVVENPTMAPRRRYSCENYDTCLNLAAAMNWDNFTCRGCCGQVNEKLCWRAHQARKKDNIADRLCAIPDIACHEDEADSKSNVIQFKFAEKAS